MVISPTIVDAIIVSSFAKLNYKPENTGKNVSNFYLIHIKLLDNSWKGKDAILGSQRKWHVQINV